MRISGIEALEQRLKEMAKAAKADDVIVGYTQDYAVYVHEMTWLQHKPGKEAKYLETPARRLARELFRVILNTFRSSGDFQKALLVAGMRLQGESQKIVPRDTSALAFSAYTAKESDAPAKAAAARARAVAKYRAEMAKRKKKKR